jgi:hypothetical protein
MGYVKSEVVGQHKGHKPKLDSPLLPSATAPSSAAAALRSRIQLNSSGS